jgi:hypothetical protein
VAGVRGAAAGPPARPPGPEPEPAEPVDGACPPGAGGWDEVCAAPSPLLARRDSPLDVGATPELAADLKPAVVVR